MLQVLQLLETENALNAPTRSESFELSKFGVIAISCLGRRHCRLSNRWFTVTNFLEVVFIWDKLGQPFIFLLLFGNARQNAFRYRTSHTIRPM